MIKFLTLFLLLLTLPTLAQTSPRVDSSVTALKTHLHKNRAKKIDQFRACLRDSGTYKRLDTMNYSYVVIHVSNYGKHIIIDEIYYTYADSAPAVMYTNGELVSRESYSYYISYNETIKNPDYEKSVSKRAFRFVQHYYHGCLVPPRNRTRRGVKAKLSTYSLSVFMNKSNSEVKTQIVLPRHFHPFILKMEGGLF